MLRYITALITLLAFSFSLPAYGQGPNEPLDDEAAIALQALQKQWGGYVPDGWRVIMAATGNLTNAKLEDAVLVIEEQDQSKIIVNDAMGEASLNTNPRALLLLSRQTHGYAVNMRHDDFLPSEGDPESPCLADPLMEGPGIKIENRNLIIALNYWYSCGTWYVNQNSYKFRFEKDRLRLIGMESWSFHRAAGLGETTSINYLTGRKKHVDNVRGLGPEPDEGDNAEWPKSETKWTRVKRGPYYLDSMKREQCAEYESAPGWCGY